MKFSKYMQKCWELAENSDCKKMKFGSVIVFDDKIIGEGFNHIADPSLAYLCNPCIRENVPSGTRGELCTAIHAEQAAMINAHHNGYNDLSKVALYVGGKFPDGKRLIKSEPGLYCSLCSRLMAEEKINEIYVPTKLGEARLTLNDVLRTSFEFARQIKKIEYNKDSG